MYTWDPRAAVQRGVCLDVWSPLQLSRLWATPPTTQKYQRYVKIKNVYLVRRQPSVVAYALCFVVIIKLTKETRRRVWRGKDQVHFKLSAAWYCSHYLPVAPVANLPPVPSIKAVNLPLIPVPRIFEKIRNNPNVIFMCLGESDSWKKSEPKNLVTLFITYLLNANRKSKKNLSQFANRLQRIFSEKKTSYLSVNCIR